MSQSPLSIGTPFRRMGKAVTSEGLGGLKETLRHGITWRMRRWRSRHKTAPSAKRKSVAPPITASAPEKQIVDLAPEVNRTSDAPLVSVIVTCRNREELLPLALRSIQMQSLTQFECIVVDDASTDASVAVAQEFANVDGRFTVVALDSNRGSSAARNTGLRHVNSPWVCFLDDDDFFLADSLLRRYERVADADHYVGGSFCGWVNIDPTVGLEVFHDDFKLSRIGDIDYADLRRGTPFVMTSPLLRRTAVEAVGGFDETLTIAEDAEFWFRFLRAGFKVVEAEHVGVVYRRSPRSKVLGAPETQLTEMNSVFLQHDAATAEPMVGPLPHASGVAEIAAVADRSPQLWKYLGLVALDDLDRAVSLGHELLPPAVRASVRPDRLARQLLNHSVARRMISDPTERFHAEAATFGLVERLMPTYDSSWEDDLSTTVPADDALATRIGTTPSVIAASEVDLSSSIVLIPEALYHVDELGPLAQQLEARGIDVQFMLTPKTVPAAVAALGRYCTRVIAFDETVADACRGIVVLNDWGPSKALIERANANGIPTFAKVEGVQDFDDADTGRDRAAYRTASIILGQGQNDADALPSKTVEVVGSTRLERLWHEGPIDRSRTVLINLNFTFNVLTESRQEWTDSVRNAVRATRTSALVSAHPAERTRNIGLPFASKSFRHEITRAGVLVSRFSTVPFEAMARGVPFVYHNPHQERVPTFASPGGAFPITTTSDELARAIMDALDGSGDPREASESFFRSQVSIDTESSSEARAADVIARIV